MKKLAAHDQQVVRIETTRDLECGELRIRVAGRLDFSSVFFFRDAYQTNDTVSTYVVDLADAEAMTGSALGILLTLRDWAHQRGAKVRLDGADEDFEALLELARLGRAFNVHQDPALNAAA